MRIRLDAKSAVHFLSLKTDDIVQVTLAPGNAGLEEFWQICRANSAKPRGWRILRTLCGLRLARDDVSAGQPYRPV
jgi:hypothetical protein